MKRFAAICAVVVFTAGVVGAARAVVGGTPDNGAHPYVVLLRIPQTDGTTSRCSGVLVSPTKILTAAHCLAAATGSVGVYFGEGPITTEPPDATTSQYVFDPLFTAVDAKGDTHDLGVITLSDGAPVTTFPALAPTGYVDAFPKKKQVTIVGYGLQSVKPQIADRERFDADVDVKNPKSAYLLYVSNSKAGACFGDSGGAILDGDVLVAIISSTQNKNCTASSAGYRIDAPGARTFLAANGV